MKNHQVFGVIMGVLLIGILFGVAFGKGGSLTLPSPILIILILIYEFVGGWFAGREWVCNQVARILGATIQSTVHNHHNYAWRESPGGRDLWVIRKGATPAFPGLLAQTD